EDEPGRNTPRESQIQINIILFIIQLSALRKHHEEEIHHHQKEIERLQKEIERHKHKIKQLKDD
uniref:Uncharacterized protein n=1 Tax=Zonotrichia albicollis TaxID=44394 RepID=A0A8D2MXB4_ZONAL